MVPTSAFNAPQATNHIRLTIAAGSCNITTGKAIDNYTTNITIPYNAVSIPSLTMPVPLQMPVNSLTIVAAALDYFSNKNGIASLISNERFRPSEVVGGVVR
jgi:hypothetical protein